MYNNNIADRNYNIVEHLRQRFKERYNIELTRELRLELLTQIKSKTAIMCCLLPRNAEVWRVRIKRSSFNVVYNNQLKEITTVLSPPDSPDFEQFCNDHPYWSKEKIMYSYMTPMERTFHDIRKAKEAKMNDKDEIDRAYDEFQAERKRQLEKEAKERLHTWQIIRKSQIKKEKARKSSNE